MIFRCAGTSGTARRPRPSTGRSGCGTIVSEMIGMESLFAFKTLGVGLRRLKFLRCISSGATNFNQSLVAWAVRPGADMDYMFDEAYDSELVLAKAPSWVIM